MPAPSIVASSYADDDGRPDEVLVRALESFAAEPGRRPEVLAALHTARVLVPVLAVAGERTAEGADKTADVAVPLLEGDDGRRALPAFSGLGPLARWDASARPVPLPGPRAAEVALAEQASVLVVDVAGPTACALAAVEVRALVEGRGRTPAYADPVLAAAVAEAASAEPEVGAAWLVPGLDVDARLEVRLPDAAAGTVPEVLARLASRLRAGPVWAATVVRGIDVAAVPDGAAPPTPPVHRRPGFDHVR